MSDSLGASLNPITDFPCFFEQNTYPSFAQLTDILVPVRYGFKHDFH